MTYRNSQDFAQETSEFRRYVYGMIRRFGITLAESASWQLLGQTGGAGGDEILPDVPAFTGIGFYAAAELGREPGSDRGRRGRHADDR